MINKLAALTVPMLYLKKDDKESQLQVFALKLISVCGINNLITKSKTSTRQLALIFPTS